MKGAHTCNTIALHVNRCVSPLVDSTFSDLFTITLKKIIDLF